MHEHVDAVGRGEPALPDRPDQRRLARSSAIDQVGERGPGREPLRIERQPIVLEPYSRAVHHQGRFLQGAPGLGRVEPG